MPRGKPKPRARRAAKKPVTPAPVPYLEQLPPELLIDIFEQIRLNAIEAGPPQSTTPYSRTLLPHVRRNLYRDVVIKNYSSLRSFVKNHSNPDIPSLVTSLIVNCDNPTGSCNDDDGETLDSVSTTDIFEFFVKTTRLLALKIRGSTQLSDLFLTHRFAACTLSAVNEMHLVLEHDIQKTSAQRFRWIGKYWLGVLSVTFYKPLMIAAGVEIAEEDVRALGRGVEGLSVNDSATGEGREVRGGDSDGGDSERGDSDWGSSIEDESESDMEDETDDSLCDSIFILDVTADLSFTHDLPAFVSMFPSLDNFSILETGIDAPDFFPLLEALPETLSYLHIEKDRPKFDLANSSMDTLPFRLPSLESLSTVGVKCTPLFYQDLHSLSDLEYLEFGPWTEVRYEAIEMIIKSGPQKILNLRSLGLDFGGERGPTYWDCDEISYDEDGNYTPHPDWSLPEFSEVFTREDADRLVVLAGEEGIVLDSSLQEAMAIDDEFWEEVTLLEELQAEHASEHSYAGSYESDSDRDV